MTELRLSVVLRSCLPLLAVLAPAPALLIGALVMARHGVPTAIWLQNIAVGLGMSVIAVVAWRFRCLRCNQACWWGIVALALIALIMTLANRGLEGVHRWVHIGPVRLHAGAIVLPALIVAIGSMANSGGRWRVVLITLTAMAILVAQPDAAQATAFGGGAIFIVAPLFQRLLPRYIFVLLLALMIGWAWLRPDPLPAIPHVEGIVGLASGQGFVWKVAAVASLLLLLVPFLGSRLPIARALAIYLGVCLLAPVIGNFPVPLLGYGVSPIIGYFVALTWLIRSRRIQLNQVAEKL